MDLALKMLKYGPTMNMVIAELIKAPKINIPLGSTPKTAPETPNIVNIPYTIAVTTSDMTKVIIIKPK